MIVKFKEWECELQFGKYSNGATALQLIDAEDGQPIATASVNLVGQSEHLDPDEVFIKDWSENEGMLDALIESGVISKPILAAPTGFVSSHLCKILIPLPSDS